MTDITIYNPAPEPTSMRAQIANVIVNASDLAKQVAQLTERLEQLEALMGDNDTRLEQSAVAFTAVNNQRIEAERGNETLRVANAELAETINSLHRKIDGLEGMNSNQSDTINGLRIDYAAAMTQREGAESEAAALARTLDTTRNELAQAKGRFTQEETDHLRTLEALEEVKRKLSDLQHKFDTAAGIFLSVVTVAPPSV